MMSSLGQLAAALGGSLMPEAMSWMYEAHWVKLALDRSTIGSLAKGQWWGRWHSHQRT